MTQPDLLRTTLSAPLEREYEAWVVLGIERYFRRVGLRVAIWAVSPNDEHTWPADESVTFQGVLFGLQFKRPQIASPLAQQTSPGYDRLKWHLDRSQMSRLLAFREIYYALPTFLNRQWRREAIHHCIFWQPECLPPSGEFWYDNPRATSNRIALARDEKAYRWGRFIELLQGQRIFAHRVARPGDAVEYTKRLAAALAELQDQQEPMSDGDAAAIPLTVNVYLFCVEIGESDSR